MEEAILLSLLAPLRNEFQTEVQVYRSPVDPDFAFHAPRGQYNSTTILSGLEQAFGGRVGKVLGVTKVDLFVPVLTYVFGEGMLGGRSAIVSAWRLDNALYGLPQDKEVYTERIIKEAMHELGHCYGLYHCREFECVMRSSSTIDEIDLKSMHFCDTCRNTMESIALNTGSTAG